MGEGMSGCNHEKCLRDKCGECCYCHTTLTPHDDTEAGQMEAEALKIIRAWRMYWMSQYQNSKEDFDNYNRRALGVDSNMQHNLAGMFARWMAERKDLELYYQSNESFDTVMKIMGERDVLQYKLAAANVVVNKLEDMIKRISWSSDCMKQSGCCEKEDGCPECSFDHASALLTEYRAIIKDLE